MEDDPKIINGRAIAKKCEEILREKISKLSDPISVVSILVGDDPPSVLYTGLKQKKALELGITFEPILFPETVSFEEVSEKVLQLNSDPSIDGIMIQLPLPKEFLGSHTHQDLTELIDPRKDIDGLTVKQIVPPAAVAAVLSIIEQEEISVSGQKVVVMGASNLVGKPMAYELEKLGGQVAIINSKTEHPEEITKSASLIICAVGKPGILDGEMVSRGVVVIDVGTLVIEDALEKDAPKKVVGDVDFETVYPKASKITPVPGGVGPMTIIALLENCFKLKSS